MKILPGILLLGFSLILSGCSSTSSPVQVEDKQVDAVAQVGSDSDDNEVVAGNVEIMLVDTLDGILSEYCLDIAGGNENVDPNNGLQAHTCYSYKGDLGSDQVFDASVLADNSLSMPIYDVCVLIDRLETGAEIGLGACDDSATAISFSGEGKITPTEAPDLCFTASEESRMGKGSQHQIRDLTLESCDDTKAAYQNWKTRSAE